MSATITWTIEWMKSKPSDGQYQNVVVNAGWRCRGVDGQVSLSSYGSASFPKPQSQFTPYDQLSEQQVLNWCWSDGGINKAEIEELLSKQIQDKISPAIVTNPLPW